MRACAPCRPSCSTTRSARTPQYGTLRRPFASRPSQVKVHFNERTASFRVTSKYTFNDLLSDAAEYWNLNKAQHRLSDGKNIWPGKAAVLSETSTLEVHLHCKESAPSKPASVVQGAAKPAPKTMEWHLLDAAARGTATQTELPKETFQRELTQEEEFLLTARLRDFSSSDWVLERLRKHGVVNEGDETRSKKLFRRFRKDVYSGKDGWLATALSYLRLNPIEFERKALDLFLEWLPGHMDIELAEETEAERLADLRDPHLWYVAARQQRRKVIAHVGPTNSGKTYGALQSFMKAESGVYCGPLRLLAHEVYEKVNDAGVRCNLVTGQLSHMHNEARHTACTIEMADVTKEIECAIVDEFQLLGDHSRGWAWSRALLGLPAKEIHLSGSDSCLGLVERLCKATGDELVVNRYKRLSPLRVLSSHMPNLRNLQKGDCVVAFSRREIYRLKAEIEEATKLRCSVVYGSLPPATRTQQAKLFNDPQSDFDVLVASDAIGMGLNLNIRRLIFSSMEKFDGIQRRPLNDAEIKQIAGRAGRYGGEYPEGEVTTMNRVDLARLRAALGQPNSPIEVAGIQPTGEQLELFMQAITTELEANRATLGKSSRKGSAPKFSTVLDHFLASARVARDFFMCSVVDMATIAKSIDDIPLQVKDRYSFCIAPVNVEDALAMTYLRGFARSFAETGRVPLSIHLPSLRTEVAIPEQLRAFESIHHVLEMYIWLAQRFSKGVFTDLGVAFSAKDRCEDAIERCLVMSGGALKRSRRHNRSSRSYVRA